MNMLILLIWLVKTQDYDIESDTVYVGDNMAKDIPYYRIHQTNMVRTNEFYERLKTSSYSFTDIQCRNHKDFYYLLYTTCLRSTLCKEMYYLEHDTGTIVTANKVNFKKFVYQLSLSQLFIVLGQEQLHIDAAVSPPQLFLLEDNIPIEWIPRYIIQLEDNPLNIPCHVAINITAEENIPFIHSTLYQLHVYKTYVVNDYRCGHYNEWLVLDVHNNAICQCRHGKICDTDSNYKVYIGILTTLMLMMVVLSIISSFVSVPQMLKKIDEANKLRYGNKGGTGKI